MQTAIVTGSARGIGRGIADRLFRDGYRLVLADIDEETLAVTAGALDGGEVLPVPTDVTSSESVSHMVERAGDFLGRIDALVNCAGIIKFSPFPEMTEDEWNRVLSVNLTGAFLCCRAVVGSMIEASSGTIVNISSIAGKTAGRGAAHYCAAKAGLIGFTQALAQDLSPYSIRVNAVCPGFIETEMLEEFLQWQSGRSSVSADHARSEMATASGRGRLGTPRDVSAVVTFLLSPEADYVTGQALNVAGTGEVH